MFWFVLVSFVTVQNAMPKLHLKLQFGPEPKRTTDSGQKRNERTQSNPLFWTHSDVLVRFGQFPYCAKNHAKVAFMHRFGPEPKRTTDSGQKRNERTQSTFLDPIVMFWFVLVSFVTVQKTMPKLHLCTDSGRNRNEPPIRERNKRAHPIHFFGPNSDVLVRFGQFRY